MAHDIEVGVDTFGDVTIGGDGRAVTQAQVLRNVGDEGVLADQAGIDFIALGERHRRDFSISTPEVVLSAIAWAVALPLKYSNGAMPHDTLMKSLELYGTKVIPRVRAALS